MRSGDTAMRKRVVKAFMNGHEIFMPQYKRSFWSALWHREFGWCYYVKDAIKEVDTKRVYFYSKADAVKYAQNNPGRNYEVVWDDSPDTVDVV